MKYIEAPTEYNGKENSLFLAGGITNCPNWQTELKNLLQNENIVLFNPRRTNFPVHDLDKTTLEQIGWEHRHLRKADAISFWFPKETICPITLYELGTWSTTDKPLFIGIHPEYQRKQDVEIQTKLVRPDIEIVYSIDSLARQIAKWAEHIK